MEPEALGPLFALPEQPGGLWILVVGFSVVTIALAALVLFRGKLPAALSSAGLLLLPFLSYALGDLWMLEETKRVTFCGSCHETMLPVVEAMHDDRATLAASHFQRGAVSHGFACYQCHSGYGIWGGVNAKVAGLSHMVHTVTGTYTLPLAPSTTFDINACLDCHATAAPFREAQAHRDPEIQRSLLAREIGCTGQCHPPAHPAGALNGVPHP